MYDSKNKKKYRAVSFMLTFVLAATAAPASGLLNVSAADEGTSDSLERYLIPKPLEYNVDENGGKFVLEDDSEIYISGDAEVEKIGTYLQEEFGKSTGYELPVMTGEGASAEDILLAADGDESLGEEGYTITVGESGIKVSGYDAHGIFNGVQTLRQLFPADIENTTVVSGVEWAAPYCDIYDKPEYSYRGAMIDSARHFFSVESVKR